jgi:pimeloyl-ACP methyl ester carboxylesterase
LPAQFEERQVADPLIDAPVSDAFGSRSESAVWSQAAQLVGIGLQLSGHAHVLEQVQQEAEILDVPSGLPPVSESQNLAESVSARDGSDNRLLAEIHRAFVSMNDAVEGERDGRSRRRTWQRHMDQLEQEDVASALAEVRRSRLNTYYPQEAGFGQERTLDAAYLLHLAQLSHQEVVRVAAAAQLAWLDGYGWTLTKQILEDGCLSTSDTVRAMAANALGHVNSADPVLRLLTTGETRAAEPDSGSRVSVTVHGTWGRSIVEKESWWWFPGQPMFQHLQQEPGASVPSPHSDVKPVGANLYDRWDTFRWDARYSEKSRLAGADELRRWCDQKGVDLDVVFAHSHGGNVALNAAARHGVKMNLLVLMSVPAHRRSDSEWEAIRRCVKRIFALRAHFDLVLLADRTYNITPRRVRKSADWDFPAEHVRAPNIPLWFSHGALTRPEVWQKHGIARHVAHELTYT